MIRLFVFSIIAALLLCFDRNGSMASKSTSEAALTLPVVTSKSLLTRANFEDSLQRLYNHIGLEAKGLSYEVFHKGMVGFYLLRQEGKLNDKNLVSIIDFSKPSTQKRFYTIDLNNPSLKYHTYVAHGRNTGENTAKAFSNKAHSNQSSLGFSVTGETYVGSKGYSMKLDGKEAFNNNMRNRAVVMHEADYVSEKWIKQYGRLGRSQGCPALPKEISKQVIDTIKDRTLLFTYFPDKTYLKSSQYLNVEKLMSQLDVAAKVSNTLTLNGK